MRNYLLKLQPMVLLLALCLCAACHSSRKGASDKNTITVTIEPLRYLTEQIAGDRFTVVSMVPQGNSPETYDPTPQQLVRLAESDAYFRIGYIGFEQNWMERLQQNVPDMKVFDTSRGVKTLRSAHHHHHHEGEAEGEHGCNIDPHIWNSFHNARIIATNICDYLCQLDKEGVSFYRKNLEQLLQKMEQTQHRADSLMNGSTDKAFLIFHPALTYFADEYGLKQISIEEEGKEPSPEHLKQIIQTCRQEQVGVTFIQQEFDRRNAELIAREAGTRLVTINPLNYQWDDEMILLAKAFHHE